MRSLIRGILECIGILNSMVLLFLGGFLIYVYSTSGSWLKICLSDYLPAKAMSWTNHITWPDLKEIIDAFWQIQVPILLIICIFICFLLSWMLRSKKQQNNEET